MTAIDHEIFSVTRFSQLSLTLRHKLGLIVRSLSTAQDDMTVRLPSVRNTATRPSPVTLMKL